ncbi:MAG: magnesium chelatase, partial [Muribaculaceae bacterium]|nr:magnesium chelatase [Muribaculaceae bacterium]
MLVKTYGAAVQGIDAIVITVELAVNRGYSYTIVGLPDTAVKESHERVRLALQSSGRELPRHNVVINLSPADVRKEGAAYDLPIAVALMA